jgi:hypothetical protein
MRSMLGFRACGPVRAAVPVSRDIDRGESNIMASNNAAASSRGWATSSLAQVRSGEIAGRTA